MDEVIPGEGYVIKWASGKVVKRRGTAVAQYEPSENVVKFPEEIGHQGDLLKVFNAHISGNSSTS